MADDGREGGGRTDARTERLKAALRENLRRRKAQGRSRAASSDAAGPTDDAAGDSVPGRPDSDKTGL